MGIFDGLLGLNPYQADASGALQAPADSGFLGNIYAGLQNNSDRLLGFGMGMLSGKDMQDGWRNAAIGMNEGGQTDQRRQLLAARAFKEAQQKKAVDEFVKANPTMSKYGALISANPELAGDFAKVDYQQSFKDNSPMTVPKGSTVLSRDGKVLFRAPDDTEDAGRKLEQEAAARERMADRLGMKPGPTRDGYIATGKMPREDAQPLTATDKKAVMEADEMVSNAQSSIESLGRAKNLSKKAYTGPTAGVRGYGMSLFGDEGGQATEELSNEVIGNALNSLRSIFGGNPTEGERAILLEMQGSVNKAPAVREAIYNKAITLAMKRKKLYEQRARELRGGTYYQEGGGSAATERAAPPDDPLAAADAIVGR